MRTTRTRAAVLGAVSAVVLVGLPATAVPAAALQHPGTPGAGQDEAPPDETAEEAKPPAVLEVPVLADEDYDDNPGQFDESDNPADTDPLSFTVASAAEPLTDPLEDGGVVDLSADTAPSPSQFEVPDDPAASDQAPDSSDEQTATDEASAAGELQGTGVDDVTDTDDTPRVEGEGAAVTTDAASATDIEATTTIAAAAEGLPDSGAAVGQVAGLGLLLTIGGLFVAGSGRHRRARHA